MRRSLPIVLVGLLLLGAGLRDGFDQWVHETDLPPLLADTSVEVRDRHGDLLRAYTVDGGIWRLGARPEQVDQTYLRMLITYEDKRFFQHSGVDPRAALRAAWHGLISGRIVSGGSTLTMQVARLMEDSGTGRWPGKLRQIRVALALEQRLSKDDILALYLTHAPFGGNIEGIRAASLAWFNKEPSRLTPAQAALLVALPQNPNARRPDRHSRAAQTARTRVLKRATRAGVLSQGDLQAAQSEPIPASRHDFPTVAAHLSDRAAQTQSDARVHHLSIAKPLQLSLETLAKNALLGLGERLSIAMVVADHETGEILASVGSARYGQNDHRQGFVDMTRARRSPGSTLKPLVYGLAFDQGLIHPETMINDRPVRFGKYAPQNFDGTFRGELKVSEALRNSLNIPVILLMDELGPANLMAAMRKAGLDPQLPGAKPGLAMALGGVGVSLEELVQLFAMQANGGITRVLTWRLGEKPLSGQRVISRSAAWHLGHILSGIVPPPGAPHNRLAYKTGTSYGHRDTWAIGYDGRHVAGVWIGRPDGTPVPGAFGAKVAAPVLFDMFQRLKPTLEPLGPPPPETILLGNAQLPEPLRKFRSRNAVFSAAEDAVKLAFPPNGARLSKTGAGLTIKVKNGQEPFSVLANGAPLATGVRRRDIQLPLSESGASTITVIDALGRSDRVEIWLE
ncbi:penicillin-binding protein 1C [Shimia aestuarii]|uniref:peptidoglycan glycosyltransferase n=1 Tax=Shimia aestuarii TaxID=254406 RepID=A0A1I4K669_9RHOB|nr:penicillin-binding protein 1C [Shimia aestuarii]SFL73936.1 penicillin-binding protein 1C [Shimia aestuarii]